MIFKGTKKRMIGWLLILLVFFSVAGTDIVKVSAKINYKKYYNPRFDYTIKYPAKFGREQYPANMDGVMMCTKSGNAQLTMSGSFNHVLDGEPYDGYSYYNSYMEEDSGKNNYSGNKGKDFAWQSYKEGNKTVYHYVFITQEVIMSFVIEYPSSQKSFYKKVIKTMKKSIRKNTNPTPYRLYQ